MKDVNCFKQLCAELVSEIQALRRAVADECGCPSPEPLVIARARATLAEGDGVGVTDEELYDLWDQEGHEADFQECRRFARAVLARYGTHPQAPIPVAEGAGVGVTDEELLELMPRQMRDNLAAASRGLGQLAGTAAGIHRVIFNTDALEYARAVLARYGTHPRPIPVAERLPTEADCDAEGTCWNWHPINFHWCLCRNDPSVHSFWLPAAAIPLSEENNE